MKCLLTVLAASSIGLSGCDQLKKMGEKSVKLESDGDKVAYAIGQQIGGSMKSQDLQINTAVLAASIDDVLNSKPSRMTPEEMQAAMTKMRQDVTAKQELVGKANIEKGAKNSTRSNSGLGNPSVSF